jgi:hypothetical protein
VRFSEIGAGFTSIYPFPKQLCLRGIEKMAFRFVEKVSPLFDYDFGTCQSTRATSGFRRQNQKAVKPS